MISWGWSSLAEVEQVTNGAFSPSRVVAAIFPLCSLAKYLASSSTDGESGCAPSTINKAICCPPEKRLQYPTSGWRSLTISVHWLGGSVNAIPQLGYR